MIHQLPLNQKWMDPQALKLVKKLQSHNHTTYLVGGCVRDLLVGLAPKDFDIATSALPEEVNQIIRPSHIIGRRFQLVLVKRFGEQYEISTFRAQSSQEESEEGPITDDNTFGSPEEDARRRDFTINSFFYDPVKTELHDYCDGMKDIKGRTIRMIGDPHTRIQEDPLRMLRAIRFAYKANFSIEPQLRQAIFQLAEQLTLSVLPRRREELLKFLRLKNASCLLWECHDLNLLEHLSPSLNHCMNENGADAFCGHLNRGLEYVSDFANPNELFSVLLFSMNAARDLQFSDHLKLTSSQEESLIRTMKEELGMYRNEQDLFLQTLEFIRKLQGIENTQKIRSRYKVHLLKSHSMSPALTLSAAYQLLPTQQLYFWTREYWKNKEIQDT